MEQMTIAEILERDGSCVVVERWDELVGWLPAAAFSKWSPATTRAETLAAETGVKHRAVLMVNYLGR